MTVDAGRATMGGQGGKGVDGAGSGAPLRSLLPVLGAHRGMVARTCGAALVEQAALVALVTGAAYVVGAAVVGRTAPSGWVVAALVGLVLVRAVATWREMDLSHDLAYRVLAELRVRVFDGLARSAPARIAGRRSGDLAATAMGDVEALEFFYAHAIAQLLASLAVFGGGAVVLAAVDPWLALAVLPVAGLLMLAPVLDGRGRAARAARTRAAAASLSAEAVETVDGLGELVAFGALERRRKQLAATGAKLARRQRGEQSWEAGAAAVRDVLVVGAVLAVVAAAAHGVATGRLGGAWAPAAMALALGVLAPVADSAAALGQAGGLRAAAARVGSAVRAPAGAPEPAAPRPVPDGPLGIRLHGVHFDYGGAEVLGGLDLTVRPGETVALVGASGAGKSTCAHLLARYWDPTSGAVELLPSPADGAPSAALPAGSATASVSPAAPTPLDLKDICDADLRRAVCVVGQEVPLFHGTLAENVRLAAPDASDGEVRAVVRACGIDRFAAGGLETAVGERGGTLSGGQRARIALARALLARPRVLVLDETTAHLDAASDGELAAALAAGSASRATVVIAHRPATIRRADRIAVLARGRVVEEGTWEELAAGGGEFARVMSRGGAA